MKESFSPFVILSAAKNAENLIPKKEGEALGATLPPVLSVKDSGEC